MHMHIEGAITFSMTRMLSIARLILSILSHEVSAYYLSHLMPSTKLSLDGGRWIYVNQETCLTLTRSLAKAT